MMFALATGQFDLGNAYQLELLELRIDFLSIYVAKEFAQNYLGPISVAAYSYMSLVPIIQPPVIKMLTTRDEKNKNEIYTS